MDLPATALPVSWTTRPLKRATILLARGSAPDYVDDGAVRVIGQMANRAGGIEWGSTRFDARIEQAPFLRGILFPGDVLLNSTGTGTLGRVGYYSAAPDSRPCLADGHITVVRANPDVADSRFLYHWLSSSFFQDFLHAALVDGSTNQVELNRERLSEAPVPFVGIEEQRRISEFLDVEAERVYRLNDLLGRQLDTLQERVWSCFDHELAQYPHEYIELRRFLDSITDGPFGSAFSSSDYSDRGPAVVRLGNIGHAEYKNAEQARIPSRLFDAFKRYSVQPGDVLVAGLGDPNNHAGRACVSPAHLGQAIVKGKCFRLRVRPHKASPHYVALALSSPRGASAVDPRGSTRSMINLEILKSAALPMPSYGDQRRIVEAVEENWTAARNAATAIEKQRHLLLERHLAVVTAAVTGRIDSSTAGGVEL